MFSDGTTGSCFGKSEGLTRLTSYFTHHNIVERPRMHPSTGQSKSKGIGSGKYPYKKFIAENLQPTLMEALDQGPVLLVCYSFSCRAVSLMFGRPNLTLTRMKNLIGIVMLSPPGSPSTDKFARKFAHNGVTFQNRKILDDAEFDKDWANSYLRIPCWVPVHFFVGAQAVKTMRDRSTNLVAALNETHITSIQQDRWPCCSWWAAQPIKPRTITIIEGGDNETCNELFVNKKGGGHPASIMG